MKCGEARVALSALLDDETPPVPLEAVRGHLDSCEPCRDWQARADRVGQLVLAEATAEPPDLTERVLAAVRETPGTARPGSRSTAAGAPAIRRRARLGLRLGVAVAALVQMWFAVPDLVAAPGHGLHHGRDGAACDIAIAVGLLLAARYPQRAQALVPVVVVLAGALAVSSGIDLASGATSAVHVLGHGLAVVQAGLLWALGRAGRGPGSGVARPVAA